MADNIYDIPQSNLPKLLKELAKLNKVAKKLSLSPVTATILETYEKKRVNEIGFDVFYNVHKVEIIGESPIIEGWAFLAVINHDKDLDRTFVRSVPGAESIPEQYYTADHRQCDHCHVFRNRNDVFVLKNEETGQYQQVGRSCLKDFLGHANPNVIAGYLEDLLRISSPSSEEDEEEGWGSDGRMTWAFDLVDMLAVTSAIIRKHGWVSKKEAMGSYDPSKVATSISVTDFMLPTTSEAIAEWKRTIEVTKKDEERAANAIAYAKELKDQGEYAYNVRTLAEVERVTPKNFGIACSMIPLYDKEASRRVARATKVNEWLGQLGNKIEVVGTIVSVIYKDSNYRFGGSSYAIVKFEDAEGRQIVWFASDPNKYSDDVLECGNRLNIRATVKKLDEYNGTKQTVITRAKVALIEEQSK